MANIYTSVVPADITPQRNVDSIVASKGHGTAYKAVEGRSNAPKGVIPEYGTQHHVGIGPQTALPGGPENPPNYKS